MIQARTLFAPGQLSPGRIAGTLNDAGYSQPNGRPLIAQDIWRIAQNAQIYAGYVRSAGVWIKGLHQPIIDEELCQSVFAVLGRRLVKQDRRFVRIQDTPRYWLGWSIATYAGEKGARRKCTIMPISANESPIGTTVQDKRGWWVMQRRRSTRRFHRTPGDGHARRARTGT